MICKWYAVARGHKTGIFTSWSECEKQVKVCHPKNVCGSRFQSPLAAK